MSDVLSQQSYRETPYEDQSWEIVGELKKNDTFVPLNFEVQNDKKTQMVDPMFADFGGRGTPNAEKQWHLPRELAYRDPRKQEIKEDPRLVKLLPEQIEELKAQAFAEGQAMGVQEGINQKAAELESLKGRIQQVLRDLAQQLQEGTQVLEGEAVKLSMQVAEKLVHHAVEINPEYIVTIIRDALSHVGSAQVKVAKVSPADYEFIQIVGLPKDLLDNVKINFEADATIKSGCVMHTSAGEIDFRLDQAFERISNEVMKVVRS